MSASATKGAVLRAGALPSQLAFFNSPAKFRAFVGGIGSGKSFALCIEILRQPAGSTGMVVAPTFQMLIDSTLKTFLDRFEPFIANHNKATLTTTLINGTVVLWRSADRPNRLRGPNLGWFAIDEAAYVSEEVWKILIGRLRRAPGRGWICTTPRGFNWVYEKFELNRLADNPNPDFAIFHARTAENKYNEPSFYETVKGDYSSAFAEQELEGQFINLESARVQRSWFKYGLPPKDLPITLGVDIASRQKTTSDYTAIVASCFDADSGNRYVLDAVRAKKTFHGILEFIKEQARRWNPTQINIENVAAQDFIVQELRRTTSLPIKPVHPAQDKLQRFLPVEGQLENGLIYFSPNITMKKEFEDELVAFDGSNKGHDDFVDALGFSLNIPTRRYGRLLA